MSKTVETLNQWEDIENKDDKIAKLLDLVDRAKVIISGLTSEHEHDCDDEPRKCFVCQAWMNASNGWRMRNETNKS